MPSPADQYWIDKILTALQNADLNETGIAEYIQDNQGATRDISTLHLDTQLARMTATELADHVDEIIHAHLINERVFYLSANDVFSLSRRRQETEAGHLLVFQECERLYQKYDEFIQRNTLKDRQTRLREQGIKLFKEKEERKAQTIDAFRALNATDKRHILRSIRHNSFKRDLQMGFAGIQTVKPTTAPSPSPLDNPPPIHEGVAELDLEQALENWNNDHDHVQSLLYPIIYQNYPSQEQIRTKGVKNFTETLKTHIPEYPEILSIKVLDDLNAQFEMDIQTSEHEAFLYHLIHIHNTQQDSKEETPSESVRLLTRQFQNPFLHFFKLVDDLIESKSFNSESPEFDRILREVCRNNVITQIEREFLEEKANEYFIDTQRLHAFLENPFVGHETFKRFIDQVCADGIITNSEKAYINEKSIEYNVPASTLEKMISNGLFQAHIKTSAINNHSFYEIATMYLIASAFNKNSITDSLQWMIKEMSTEKDNDTALKEFSEMIFKDLKNSFDNSAISMSRTMSDLGFYLGCETPPINTAILTFQSTIEQSKFSLPDKAELNALQEHLGLLQLILNEEKMRIGSPQANLLADNVIFRIENNLI